jgi:hypothetical protein
LSETRHRPFVERSGDGEAVLFIHGTVISGRSTWRAQRPLSARWQVQVLERRGYPPNPAVEREDFREDAEDVKALLSAAPAHLVAHSYGAVGARCSRCAGPGQITDRRRAGGHHAAFDAACRELAVRANASLITLTGRGHSPQQLGEEFNTVLEKSLRGGSLPSATRRT